MSRRGIIVTFSSFYCLGEKSGRAAPTAKKVAFLLLSATGAGDRPGVPVWVLPARPALGPGVEEGSCQTSFELPFLCHV